MYLLAEIDGLLADEILEIAPVGSGIAAIEFCSRTIYEHNWHST